MSTWVRYFSTRRIGAAFVVAIYAIAMITTHDLVQQMVFALQYLVGPKRWLTGVFAFALVAGLGAAVWLARTAWQSCERGLLLSYLLLTGLLLAGSYATLIMVSNECAHFVQYALLAGLIFPLTKRYGDTVAWCALIGLLDEGYQYFYLHAHWPTYFDFNDVVLNVIGAGVGVVALRAGLKSPPNRDERARLWGWGQLAISVLFVVGFVMALSGSLRGLPLEDADAGAITLRRCGTGPIWMTSDLGKGYHELLPIEGTAILAVLLVIYSGLDARRFATTMIREPRREETASPLTASKQPIASD